MTTNTLISGIEAPHHSSKFPSSRAKRHLQLLPHLARVQQWVAGHLHRPQRTAVAAEPDDDMIGFSSAVGTATRRPPLCISIWARATVEETRIKDHKVIASENIEINQRKAVVYRATDIIKNYLHDFKSFSVFIISKNLTKNNCRIPTWKVASLSISNGKTFQVISYLN